MSTKVAVNPYQSRADGGAGGESRPELNCEYVSGSLRELTMIDEWFEGSDTVTIYLLEFGAEPSEVCRLPAEK